MIPLSEAIRIGSLMNKQIRGQYWDGNGGTCALGSAAWVNGISLTELTLISLRGAFPILNILHRQYFGNDVFGVMPLHEAIVYWNDVKFMSREEIADKILAIEILENQSKITDKELVYGVK